MNAEVSGWQLLAGWMIIIVLIGGTVALLQRSHRRSTVPRPRPEHSAGAEDADRRRLHSDLAAIAVPTVAAAPPPDDLSNLQDESSAGRRVRPQSSLSGDRAQGHGKPAALAGAPTGTKVPECLPTP